MIDDIRKRLEDAGLTIDGDFIDGWVEAHGFTSAWRKALGPTREQLFDAVRQAVHDEELTTLPDFLRDESREAFAASRAQSVLYRLANLYP